MIPKVLELTGYAKDDFGYDSFAKDSFGKNGFGMNGFGKNGFGKDGFGKDGYGKDGFGKDAGLFSSKITSRGGWGRVVFQATNLAILVYSNLLQLLQFVAIYRSLLVSEIYKDV